MSAFSKILPGKPKKQHPKPPKQHAKAHCKRAKGADKRRPRPIGR
ncbi:hypothetical protein [Streptomyces odontomachi]|nr:hypothetical protein [Streptomyces sp. ODS25]